MNETKISIIIKNHLYRFSRQSYYIEFWFYKNNKHYCEFNYYPFNHALNNNFSNFIACNFYEKAKILDEIYPLFNELIEKMHGSFVHENASDEILYINNFLLHRDDDGPSLIRYEADDKRVLLKEEIYYKHGLITRSLDKPSRIRYQIDGFMAIETFYKNGEIHRDNGPAIIKYKAHGIHFKEYWKYNKFISSL